MTKNNIDSRGYTALWIIVIILTIIVFATFFVNHIGHGRWECIEYKTYCSECETSGTDIIKIYNQELEMKWHTANENMCVCIEYEKVCIREVWTRYPKQ